MDGRRRATGIACLAILAAARIRAAELVLVEDGKPRATIVIAEDAREKARRAAAELAAYIEKISGATLPIATEDAAPSGPLILVGRSALAEAAGIPIPAGVSHARREEGFVIATAGDRLILAGNEDGPYHGTEYAVYDFLRMLGVRWFMPGEFGEIVPRRPTIAIGAIRIEERPDFIMRNWWLHALPELAEKERIWKLRNKMNPDPIFAIPGDSSVRNVLPAEAFREHPEYFALNGDGSRNPHFPNLSHPKAVEMVAGVIRDYFRKNPGANSYGFAPDDGLPRDESPETVALNQGFVELGGRPGVPAELSISEEWFGFVNRVAAEVRKEFPDRTIATNGYANRDIPPQGLAIDDHLVVMFAAIWSCTLHAYDDEHCWQKVRQGRMLWRWAELCPNVWVYGYNYGMLVSALTPIPMTRKLRRDFPLMKRWNVIGFLDESRNVWAECGIATRYLRAQLEWDADADVDAILADFTARWYGEAAGPMRAFWDALERAIEEAPIHGHEDRVLPEIYTPPLMATLREAIAEAERRATDGRVRIRVRADRLIFDHLEAYVAMAAAEAAGEFAAAARAAERMLAIRKELHAIDPFFIWHDEARYHSGIWYWGLAERKAFYESLAEKTSGKTGDLLALLPEEAAFRADPHDDGIFDAWYAPGLDEREWTTIRTTRPFYVQGYQDERGHPFVGYVWYRLRADVPAEAAGRKILLYAPVAETEAWCWVEGKYVGHRPYREAYVRPSPIELDASDAVRPGASNAIAIRVSTSLSPAQAASGLLGRVFLYAPRSSPAGAGADARGGGPAAPRIVLRDAPPIEFRGANNPNGDRPGESDSNSPVIWDRDSCIVFNSAGHPWRNAGRDPFGPPDSSARVSFDNEVNGGRWFESVWREEDGTLYAWYHFEPNDVCPEARPKKHLTAPKIGAARSRDGGVSWKDLGIVLEAPPGLRCDTENHYFAGGNGDFSVILDRQRRFFYFFISTYGDLAEQGVAVARMAYADRDAPAGNVWKWHRGSWKEPGIGGRLTPIFPAAKDWHGKDADAFWGPSIHWNDHLETYAILLNRTMDANWTQEGIYATFNPDLSDPAAWTPPAKILDRADLLPRLRWKDAWYPQVIGLRKGDTDTLAGRVARLYVRGESHWEIEFRKGE